MEHKDRVVFAQKIVDCLGAVEMGLMNGKFDVVHNGLAHIAVKLFTQEYLHEKSRDLFCGYRSKLENIRHEIEMAVDAVLEIETNNYHYFGDPDNEDRDDLSDEEEEARDKKNAIGMIQNLINKSIKAINRYAGIKETNDE